MKKFTIKILVTSLLLNGCTLMSTKVGNLLSYDSDSKENLTVIGKLNVENNKLVFVVAHNAQLIDNKSLKEKIRRVELAITEINKNGYLEISDGGQSFADDGSSTRWDGSRIIHISNSKEFRDNFLIYLFYNYRVELKIN